MPIPPFDGILNILPPHLGDPTQTADHSPYPCTTEEFCQRFSTSNQRRQILEGFLRLRKELFSLGIRGFHWLDGSFLEDIEAQARRDPRDIDVITFIADPFDLTSLAALIGSNQWMVDRNHTKSTYLVDHFLVPLGSAPRRLVDQSRYWYSLFSHRRDGIWKGMLTIGLDDPNDDTAACGLLGVAP